MGWHKIKAYVVGAVGAVLGSLSVYFIGRRRGAKDEQNKQFRASVKESRKIQDKADRVRRADGNGLPAVERLRRYKRLRDVSDDL